MTDYNYTKSNDPIEDDVKKEIEGDKTLGAKPKGRKYYYLILLIGCATLAISLFLIFNGDWRTFSDPGIIRWDYVTDNIGGFEILLVGIVFVSTAIAKLWKSFH
jgi:hypothetical protein